METLKFNVFNFLNKSKKTAVPLVVLCPTFPYVKSISYIKEFAKGSMFVAFVEISY